jgi:putative glycosyltransferase
MKLSIVSTLYKSSPYLEEFCRRAAAVAEQQVGIDYEIVLVNDGSPDDSLQIALTLQTRSPNIQIVNLSRNFGHYAAITAGLQNSRGEMVFLIDCDLEEQPEWLPRFTEKMIESGADVVFGVQEERTASRTGNILGELFWSALNLMSSIRIPHNSMTCRVMTRTYIEALLSVQDRVLFLAGTFAWAGFTQIAIPLRKPPRPKTYKSTYNLSRKLTLVVDSFSSFSIAPLTVLFFSGLVLWFGSIAFASFIFIRKILFPEMILSGFTSIMISIWFLGGTVILALGILGLYMGKIFQEVKRRPLYIVQSVYRGTNEERT